MANKRKQRGRRKNTSKQEIPVKMKGVYKEKEEGMLRPKWKERYRCSRVVASVSFLLCMLEAADNLGNEGTEGVCGWKIQKKR